MPLNIKGEGPETDVDKIAVILYQVCDEAFVTHFEYYNEKDALDKVAELNEENDAEK